MKNKSSLIALILIYVVSVFVPIQATEPQTSDPTNNESQSNLVNSKIDSSTPQLPALVDTSSDISFLEILPIITESRATVEMQEASKWNIKVQTNLRLTRPHDSIVSVNSQLYKLTPGSSEYKKVVKLREILYLDYITHPNDGTAYETIEQLTPGQYKLLYEATSGDMDRKYRDTKVMYFTVTKELGAGNSWFNDDIEQSSFLIKSKIRKVVPVGIEMRSGAMEKGTTFFPTNWTVDIESLVVLDQPTDQPVILTSRLYQLSADLNKELTYSEQKTIFTKNLAYHVPETLTQQFTSLPQGQYRLELESTSQQSEHDSYGGLEIFFFTVKDDGVREGWLENIPTQIDVNSPISSDNQNCKQQERINSKIITMTIPNVTLKGKFTMIGRQNIETPIQEAKFRVEYLDCWGKWQLVAIQQTDFFGYFNVTYPQIHDALGWKIELSTENGYGHVINWKKEAYQMTMYYADLSSGGDLGNQQLPQEKLSVMPFNLMNDIVRIYNFFQPYYIPKATIEVRYDPTGTVSPYKNKIAFVRDENFVNMNLKFAESPNTNLHELAHFYMYNIYGKWMPPTECKGEHIYYGTTDPECAWKEGWAHFISAAVNWNSIFVYTQGLSFDLEHTTTFQNNGDLVEGRVAGALWDLYDDQDDGKDTRDYTFEKIYKATFQTPSGEKINNLSEFWKNWKFIINQKGAKYSIHQNEIMYDPDTMLEFDKPQQLNGDIIKVFAIQGIGRVPVITASFSKKPSHVALELYEDVDLNNMLIMEHNSTVNGYAKIDEYYLSDDKLYYLVVRNFDYSEPFYAEVNMSLDIRSPRNMPRYNLMNPDQPELIADKTNDVFAIEGDGTPITIESTYNQVWTDTVLEVYRDEKLTELVISDDDSGSGTYARITNLKIPDKRIYYVKIRNFQAGELVNATVNYAATPSSEPYGEFIGNFPWQLSSSTGLILKVIGEGKPITFETSYFLEQSDPFLELYQDEAMTELIAMDDDSAGGKYARLEQILLNAGQTYYLKVSHFREGTPVYALVKIMKK